MAPQEIDKLAKKWQDGTINDEERTRFEHWYRSFDDSLLEIDSDEGAAAMKLRLYRQIAEAGAIPAEVPTRSRRGWMRYAAVVAMLVVAFLFYWNHQNAFTDRPWIAHVNIRTGDAIQRAILPDGSIIWLRPGATLHYLNAFDMRRVELTGEALFEVAKIPERPFRVQVGDYVAVVRGTSFNIRQSDNGRDMELVVLTGEVAVSKRQPDHSAEEIVLLPNQRLKTAAGLTLADPPVEVVQLPHENEYTQGTAYNMWFDNTPFEEVARRISAKFGITVEMAGDQYRDCRISANLSDESLAYTVELVAAALGAEYEIGKNKIILKGGGCL